MLDVKKLLTKLLNRSAMFNTVLWTGTWSSSTITVPHTADYCVFLINQNNQWIIAIKDATSGAVTGCWITGTTSYNQYSRVFSCSTSGNTWTWGYAKQINHNASSNHGAGATHTVSAIIGLIPS